MDISDFPSRNEYLAYLHALTLRGGSTAASAQAEIAKYDESQPRDDHGRWTRGGGGASSSDTESRDNRSKGIESGFSHSNLPSEIVGDNKHPIPFQVGDRTYYIDYKLDKDHSLWHRMEADADGNLRLSPERAAFYEQYVKGETAKCTYVPPADERTYYMMGGGPASGKSSAIDSGMLTDVPNTNPDKGEVQAVLANPDEAKKMLMEATPEAASSGVVASSYVHEESSIVAKMLDAQAKEEGKNVLLDGTGDSSAKKLEGKIDDAHDNGYIVKGAYAFCPMDEAISRAEARASGVEGRSVPKSAIVETTASVSEVIGDPDNWDRTLRKFDSLNLYDTTSGNPRSEGHFDENGNKQPSEGVAFNPAVGRLTTPDGTVVYARPVLAMTYTGGDENPVIHDQASWDKFRSLAAYSALVPGIKAAEEAARATGKAAQPDTGSGITWAQWVKAGRPNLFKVGDGATKPFTVEQVNALIHAAAFDKSLKEAGIPEGPRVKALYDAICDDVAKLKAANISIDMVKEHPDPSPKK